MQNWYRQVAALDRNAHAKLRLNTNPDLSFVAQEMALPLGLEELEFASATYPIVFSAGDQTLPLAVLGVKPGENLFVTPNHKWVAGAYIPAVVRNYPFVVIDAGAQGQVIGLDTASDLLGEGGEGPALFDEGELTEVGKERLGLAAAYRETMRRSLDFGKALREAGCLDGQRAQISLPGVEEKLRVEGFMTVNPKSLDKLSDETLLDWRRKGYLQALMHHFASGGQWQRLIALAGARQALAPQLEAAKPSSAATPAAKKTGKAKAAKAG